MRRRLVTALFVFFVFATSETLPAQTPPTSTGPVIGSGNFSPIVKDLDKSLDFYRSLLGVTPPPNAAPITFGNDSALLNFLGTPTAQVRFNTVRIPNSPMGIEIVEFKDIDRRAVQPRMQDPGATWLVLMVRDIDAVLGRLKKFGPTVVTAGGSPVLVSDPGNSGTKIRAVVIKDPDGFNVVMGQPSVLPEVTAPPTSDVIEARVGLTVADMDKTMAVYRDLLGFQPQIRGFGRDQAISDLFNTSGAEFRRATAQIPGSTVQMEFFEFRGIERKAITPRIQDSGATRLQLRVRDTDAAVKTLVGAGGVVTTTGGNGGPIDMRGLRVALVRDLNNLFLVIMAQGQTR